MKGFKPYGLDTELDINLDKEHGYDESVLEEEKKKLIWHTPPQPIEEVKADTNEQECYKTMPWLTKDLKEND